MLGPESTHTLSSRQNFITDTALEDKAELAALELCFGRSLICPNMFTWSSQNWS